MSAATPTVPDLESIASGKNTLHNLSVSALIEKAVRRNEVELVSNGAIVGYTNRTGRSPKDKFVVRDAITANKVAWGSVNQPFDADKFDALYQRVYDYLKPQDELFVQDLFCGADPEYRLKVRFINQYAWHNLFVKQLFIRPTASELADFAPDFTVLSAPDFKARPASATAPRSEVFVMVNFTRKIILVGGTQYAGELKKSIFGIMNFLLPQRDVFPMHCSANIGKDGRSALFFGLSGTGKTTLSADPERGLIGDDEHGWSPKGIFNFEGGCYAKMIKLRQESEPQIWGALRYGTVFENVDHRSGDPGAGF